MPEVKSILELKQVQKLLYSVRTEDTTHITKLTTYGVPDLINYRGKMSAESLLWVGRVLDNRLTASPVHGPDVFETL